MIQVGEIVAAQARLIIVAGIEISVTEISQEIIMGIENLLEIEAKTMAILVETKEVEAEVEVDLIQVPMSEDCKVLFAGFCRVWTFYQSSCCLHKFFLVFSFRGVRFCFGEYL